MLTRSFIAAFVLAPLTACSICRAAAGVIYPTSAGGTGNAYEVVVNPSFNHDAAQAAAESAGGNLVTITSPGEQSFVESLLVSSGAPSGSYWFGLDRITDEAFAWETGESFSYNHFPSGEPNNYQHDEIAGTLYWSHNLADPDGARRGGWNDVPADGYPNTDIVDLVRTGYIVERLPAPGDVTSPPPIAIPLPPAVFAVPFGLIAAGIASRRRCARV